jgi:hypothetical protein
MLYKKLVMTILVCSSTLISALSISDRIMNNNHLSLLGQRLTYKQAAEGSSTDDDSFVPADKDSKIIYGPNAS